jgi:hypothetical protein
MSDWSEMFNNRAIFDIITDTMPALDLYCLRDVSPALNQRIKRSLVGELKRGVPAAFSAPKEETTVMNKSMYQGRVQVAIGVLEVVIEKHARSLVQNLRDVSRALTQLTKSPLVDESIYPGRVQAAIGVLEGLIEKHTDMDMFELFEKTLATERENYDIPASEYKDGLAEIHIEFWDLACDLQIAMQDEWYAALPDSLE